MIVVRRGRVGLAPGPTGHPTGDVAAASSHDDHVAAGAGAPPAPVRRGAPSSSSSSRRPDLVYWGPIGPGVAPA